MTSALELKVIFAAVDRFVRPVNNITNSASAAAKALRENTARLKELDKTVANIDAFKKAEKEAAITANTFHKNQRALEELKAAITRVGVPTKAMAAELERLGKRSDELRNKHQTLTNTEQRLFEKLKAAKVDTSNLAEARRQLAGASAHATNESHRLSTALDAENQKMRRLRAAQADLAKAREKASKLTGLGTKMMAGGAAINAAAAVPVLAYAQAEDAATQLKIAMMQRGGHVSSQFAEIDALAMKLGNRLPGTTADFQDMMTMLIRQGMPASTILGGLGEATAYLAAQLKMAPRDAAEFASKLQDATRATDKEMMGLMDTIQKTFYLGVDQNNMLQGFAKLSPALSVIKKEGAEAARELAPLLVMTDQAGMQGEASGNAFRKIFQMSLDAKKLAKGNAELAGTGIKLNFSDGKGEFGGLAKMYAQLEKLRNVSTQQRLAALKKIFGDDAETLQALTIMIEKGAAGYADVQAKLSAQANIQERVNAQLATLKSLWDAASGTFTNALVAFGEAIAPELHAAAEMLGKVAERTQEWAKNNPALAGGLMTVVKWVGMAALGLGAITAAAGAILVPLAMLKFSMVTLGITGSGAIGMIGTAFATVGRLMLLNPIGLAITGLIAAAALIYTYWTPIKGFFSSLWAGISATGRLAVDGIKGWFSSLPDYFRTIGAAITAGLWNSLSSGWSALVAKVEGLAQLLPDAVKRVLGIRSPSRVFAELGMHTMAGLEQGITKNSEGPAAALKRAAAALVSGAGIAITAPAIALPQTEPPAAIRKIVGAPDAQPARQATTLKRLIADVHQSINLPDPPPAIRKILDQQADQSERIDDHKTVQTAETNARQQPAPAYVGNTYQITISLPAGSDHADLEARLEKTIERIERRRAAQYRSRLRDQE